MISSSPATPTCAIGKNQFSLSPNVVLRLFQTLNMGVTWKNKLGSLVTRL